jgi:hypothetical protein
MKRLFASLIAPLLVMTLMSFTPPDGQDHHVRGSDSTNVVNVHFTPASVVVKDNRTTEGMTSVIDKNSESNTAVAKSINTVAETLLSMEQERRCVSIMDRITQKTGLSVTEVNQIIHKKRVWDITFYTLFSLYTLYILFGLASMTWHTSIISMKEWGIKITSAFSSLLLLYVFYLTIDLILNGKYYPTIQSIINSASG